MKIAYLISHDISKNDGVTKKISAQVSAWEQMGNTVALYAFVPHDTECLLNANNFVMKGAFKHRFLLNRELSDSIREFNPDILYVRNFVLNKTLLYLLASVKTIIEVNTHEPNEYLARIRDEKSIKSLLRYVMYLMTRKALFNRAKGVVSVTNEILNDLTHSCKLRTSIVIPNSIPIMDSGFHKSKVVFSKKDRIGLFFMGTPSQSWHGIDIIEKMAQVFPDYNFHIVGPSGLSKGNIFYEGYLEPARYYEVLKRCHICIGTLALHRKNMSEACPLKVREYLSLGYPVIIGYKDTAFSSDFEYVYKLDTETEIDFSNMKYFIEKYARVSVPTVAVRPLISTDILEEKRVKYFKDVINKDEKNHGS